MRMSKSLAVISFTDRGAALSDKLIYLTDSDKKNASSQTAGDFFGEIRHYPCEKGGLSALVAEVFERFDALLFVGAAGIAVRAIAPHIKSKMSDPAVIVADERGKFVIPLLSGHVGGANEAAQYIADILGAAPVITTATDISGVFAVDTWAAKCGYFIANPEKIKDVSAKVLRGGRVEMLSDAPLISPPPYEQVNVGVLSANSAVVSGRECDVYVGARRLAGDFLRLVPKSVYVGIGCRKGAVQAAVGELFDSVMLEFGIDPRAVAAVASIDIKSAEGGLLGFAGERGYELLFYSAGELRALAGVFSASEFVESVTGVDCVCERAALLAAMGGRAWAVFGESDAVGARLIVKKTALNGVTVAVAAAESV